MKCLGWLVCSALYCVIYAAALLIVGAALGIGAVVEWVMSKREEFNS